MNDEIPSVVICQVCGKPMQLADEVKHGDIVVARRYVCFCGDQLKHKNIHRGQAGKK